MKEKDILAWSKHPEPEGAMYSATELGNVDIVKELLASCVKREAYVNSEGWQFLFETYQLESLAESKEKGKYIIYHSLSCGYNPITKKKGDYDDETKTFIGLDGTKQKIDWDNI